MSNDKNSDITKFLSGLSDVDLEVAKKLYDKRRQLERQKEYYDDKRNFKRLFGERLSKLRCDLGLSLQDFDELLGVHYQKLIEMENGINLPDLVVFRKIVKNSGVPAEYFLALDEEPEKTNFGGNND